MSTLTDSELITRYRKLRDKRNDMEEAHKKRRRPILDGMAKIEALMLERMNLHKTDTIGAKGVGTASRVVKTSVTVKSRKDFQAFVEEHDLGHLVDYRPAKVAVMEYMEEQGEDVPGVKIQQFETVSIVKGRT